MMKKPKSTKVAFIIMGIFIIEIIGLMQAIFSEQVIKYNLEQQIEYSSEMLLNQFMDSYSAKGDIQESIQNLSYQNFDDGLVSLYESLRETIAVKKAPKEVHYLSGGRYQLDIIPNTEVNRQIYDERLGLNVGTIQDYKILSYEMKQGDRSLMERRILLGLSKDKQWLISVEINQEIVRKWMEETNRSMAGLMNSSYYFSDKTGNFYVFESNGKVLYQGGLEKNVGYFNAVDLNTNKKVIDLIRQEKDHYQRVIYKKEKNVNRSLMRTIYNKDKDLYFVYEIDQTKVLGDVELQLKLTWFIGLGVLSATFVLLYVIWQVHKRTRGKYPL